MAVVQYTAVVNQVRGKLNGSVFNRSRTVNTLSRKQEPPKGTRGFQSESRQLFQFVQRQWKSLDAGAKQLWQQVAQNNPDRDRFGNLVILSGYNKYIQCFMLSLYSGDIVAVGAPNPASAPAVTVSGWDVVPTITQLADGTARIDGYIAIGGVPATTDHSFILDVSLPISGGVTAYHGRYSNIAGTSFDETFPYGFGQDMGLSFPMPQVGERLQFRLRIIDNGAGVVVYTDYYLFTL